MTTSPSPAVPEPHQHRAIAQSFGSDAQRYDRTRAPYPAAMIERIVTAASGPEFLNVGSGTGIEARQFQAAGRVVLGVEPDERMAEFSRATGVDVEVGTFEEWDPAGRMFDAIVCGTAWHWVDPLAGAAKAGRILRPGAVLAPFGHVYEPPPAVATAVTEGLSRVSPGSPFTGRAGQGSIREGYRAIYDRAAEAVRAVGGFAEPEVWRYDWERDYTRDELLDLIPTSGGMTTLPAEHVEQVLASVGAAVDELGGTVRMPYTTWGLTAVRLAS
jgi:SAM-dependent methyltransferase